MDYINGVVIRRYMICGGSFGKGEFPYYIEAWCNGSAAVFPGAASQWSASIGNYDVDGG